MLIYALLPLCQCASPSLAFQLCPSHAPTSPPLVPYGVRCHPAPAEWHVSARYDGKHGPLASEPQSQLAPALRPPCTYVLQPSDSTLQAHFRSTEGYVP